MKKTILSEEEFELEGDIYTKDGISSLVDDDEISSTEEGFMLGYLDALTEA